MLYLLTLFFCFGFIMKRAKKLSVFFRQKRLQDKEGEAAEVSSISQPAELQEPIGDGVADVSRSNFQCRSLTQTIFEMPQFKMPCGTDGPL